MGADCAGADRACQGHSGGIATKKAVENRVIQGRFLYISRPFYKFLFYKNRLVNGERFYEQNNSD
jgi:hypothetical protein